MKNPFKEMARLLINAENIFGEGQGSAFRQLAQIITSAACYTPIDEFPTLSDHTRIDVRLSAIVPTDSEDRTERLFESKNSLAVDAINNLAISNNGTRAVFVHGGRKLDWVDVEYITNMLYVFPTPTEGMSFVDDVKCVFHFSNVQTRLTPKMYKSVDDIIDEYRRIIEAEEEKTNGDSN